MQIVALPAALLFASVAWSVGLAPWAANTDPTDVARTHVEEISDADHAYMVIQGGTMDGENCRPPVGYGAWHQTWESNRWVRLENTGDTVVVNPWLSNGRNNFRTIEEIVAGALEPGMTEREKAIAVWRWEMDHRFHAYTADNEVNDPVKVFNVYGYTLCGNDAICLSGLWRTAGLTVRPARPIGHCVTEVFYDDAWHLLDGDEHCIFLLRDNDTIAGEAQIVRDHDLIKRTHTYGILQRDGRDRDEFSASLYIFDGEGGGTRDCVRGHSMAMELRPGEALTWRWGHAVPHKFHGLQDIKDWGQNATDKVCNGLWEYRPDLTRDLWRQGAETVEGIVSVDGQLRSEPGKTGVVIWRMRSPYVFVGGKLDAEAPGARFSLSWDGKKWETATGSLDSFFPPAGPARYEYYLRCELPGNATLSRPAITNDIQMAPLSLPGMAVGENSFQYTDETPGDRRVRITHSWVERSGSRPPSAPPAAIFPPDRSSVEGTDFIFDWQPAEDPDGDEIADYHFELSGRADMKWPLSPNFEKLVSHTADRGYPRYTLPYVGLLSPGRVYYWRVRARDAKGLWGPWSDVWQFTVQAPSVPVDVRIEFDPETKTGVLRWSAGPGREPASYRVYGSDEKGFTVSEEPYTVNVGNQPEKLDKLFPANFVAETKDAQLTVIGPGLTLTNANRAHYRIVAVDARGNRSGSSDYVGAPRPLIVSVPGTIGRAGEPYSYPVQVIRSLGDLRCRLIEGKPYNSNFWDVERPALSMVKGPGWLTLDETTQTLTGTPPGPGEYAVTIEATIESEGTDRQSFLLRIQE